jgi:hypothetical protein
MTKLLAVALLSMGAILAQNVTAVPKVTGPVPVTATSYPFLAADHNLQPDDLSKVGYVEEEFIITGTANVYNWAADGSVSVKTANAPYGNRILVRRPANAARFSGTVVVELLSQARKFDWSLMYSYLRDQIIAQGDAWVGVTLPGSMDGLKKFNPTRYVAVSMANPTPTAACPGAKGAPSPMEEGLRWDMISQVGSLLKSNAPGRPLTNFTVQHVLMTTQWGDITTYVNAIHSRARLAGGKPVYDGYLIKNPPSPLRINQCADAPAAGDPRRVVKNVDVPVVAVTAQGELIDALWARRPDSDDPGGRFRLYEIAGAAHIDKFAYPALPSFADQIAAVGSAQGTPEWPFSAPCEPPIPLSSHPLLKYALHGALVNLDQWVEKGTPPPHAPRIDVKDAGTPKASLVTDTAGNGMGGVRSPYVDAPIATYFTTTPGPGNCRELGYTVMLDPAVRQKLNGDQKSYQVKVAQSVDRAVKSGFFTEADGKKMKAELK